MSYFFTIDPKSFLKLSEKESIPVSLVSAHVKQNDRMNNIRSHGATESRSCERVGSQKECNLFGSSLISLSLILVRLLTLQRFCDFTQMLFMW